MAVNDTDILNQSSAQTNSDEKRFKEASIAMAILNIPLCLTALLGNAAVLAAIGKNYLRSPARMFLASLALSDLAVGLVAQPLFISCMVLAGFNGVSIFDGKVWKVFSILSYFLCAASFLTVTAISVDRLLALELHLRYNVVVTQRRSIMVVAAVWLISGVVSGMRQWNIKIFFTTLALIISICLFGTFVVYLKILRIVRRHQSQIQCQEQEASGNFLRVARLKKSALNTFYVYILFLLCYVPYLSVMLAALTTQKRFNITFSIATTIVLLNSGLNPLLYCWRLREIRADIKQRIRIFCS